MDAVDDVAAQLLRTLRGLKDLHAEVLAQIDVRVEMPAAMVLATLDERGPARASTIAEVLHLDSSSVSRQVCALEREGWLARERDEADHRAWLLDLTPTGREVLRQVRAGRARALRAVLSNWSLEDLAPFARGLERFAVDLTHHDSGAACPSVLQSAQQGA